MENSQIDEVVQWVTQSDFWYSDLAEVMTAILAIRDSGEAVDGVTLADHMAIEDRYQQLGGDRLLREIMDSVPHGANAVYYARIVRELSITRQILEACQETAREIYSRQFTAPDLIDRVEGRIFRITDRAAVGTTIDGSQLAIETRDRMLVLSERRCIGLPTGYSDLDGIVGGFQPEQFIILASRPAIGKTALALNIASGIASEGHAVLFVSLEMSRVELGNRLVSAFGGIDSTSIQKPWLFASDDWTRVGEALQRVAAFPLWIDDTPIRTVSQIAANARRVKHRSASGLKLIVVDYLGLIHGQRQKGENRQEEVARISRRLKSIAREIGVPLLCLHQLNRLPEGRDGGQPRMSDLRESGQIEQDADVVLLLHRPEQANPADRPNEANVIVAKNRNGPTGVVTLIFMKALMRFDSFAQSPTKPF